ncbi:MFS transporter [Collinsella provencensis]|uniref:MFS transporter n=1 Tax=Collinsella provencensis TaxID=1937461 RepID=UPI00131BC382|nr:MFS transporter [Collinsella provencensis]
MPKNDSVVRPEEVRCSGAAHLLFGRTSMLVRCCLCFGCSIALVNDSLNLFTAPVSEALGVGIGDFSLILTIVNLVSGVMALVVPHLLDRLPLRMVMAGGVVLASVSYVALVFVPNIMWFYLGAVAIGISGCCFSTIPVTYVLQSWYGAKNGFAVGIAMACSGMIGAIFSPIIGWLIESIGYQFTLGVLAAAFVVIALPSALTVRFGPETLYEHAESDATDVEVFSERMPTVLYLLLMVCVACFSLLVALSGHLSIIGLDLGFDLASASLLVSSSLVASVFLKVLVGFLADRIGSIQAVALSCLCSVTGVAILAVAGASLPLAMAGAFLLGGSAACHTVGLTLITQYVADQDFKRVFSHVTVAACLLYAIFVWLLGVLRDVFGGYGFGIALTFAVGCAALMLCFVLAHARKATLRAA